MSAESRDLTDTVVAITGASSGIGAARVLVVTGDVQDPISASDLISGAVEHFGGLHSIIVNAGIGMYGGILDASDIDLQRMMRTNVEGTVWAVRAAVSQFRRAPKGGGDIVIVSSVAGLHGGADEAVYAATKFAQVGLAGALDREVRAEGIRVTAICPAGVHTEFAIGVGRTEGDPALNDYLLPDDVASAITIVLQQPRRVRTTQWQLWSMAQSS